MHVFSCQYNELHLCIFEMRMSPRLSYNSQALGSSHLCALGARLHAMQPHLDTAFLPKEETLVSLLF